MDFDVSPGGVIIPRIKPVVPTSPWVLTKHGVEIFRDFLDKEEMSLYDRIFKARSPEEQMGIVRMAGSLSFYISKKVQDIIHGATAYTAVTPYFVHLYTSALDDTFNGATAGKAAYTSYAGLSLTNNTTIFASGSGTTTYTKTWPSDAAKSWATSTGGTAPTVTYLGVLDANAGSSADNGIEWCTVTSTTINTGDTPQLAQNAMTVVQD